MLKNTNDDLSGLIFTRSSAAKVLGLDPPPSVLPALNTTFTLFSSLPAELRLIIWKFAVSEARIIVVSYTTTTTGGGEGDNDHPRVFVDTPPPPPCLSACRESRAVALKRYKKCLVTNQCVSPTFLNFENDCFLLGGPDASLDMDYLMSILLPGNSHRVRYLHTSRGCWKELAYWTHLRTRYSGLEELTISFPSGAALLPYTHDCWYGALSRENKEIVVKIELYEQQEVNDHDDDEPKRQPGGWKPGFGLKIIHYDSPLSKGNY